MSVRTACKYQIEFRLLLIVLERFKIAWRFKLARLKWHSTSTSHECNPVRDDNPKSLPNCKICTDLSCLLVNRPPLQWIMTFWPLWNLKLPFVAIAWKGNQCRSSLYSTEAKKSHTGLEQNEGEVMMKVFSFWVELILLSFFPNCHEAKRNVFVFSPIFHTFRTKLMSWQHHSCSLTSWDGMWLNRAVLDLCSERSISLCSLRISLRSPICLSALSTNGLYMAVGQ